MTSSSGSRARAALGAVTPVVLLLLFLALVPDGPGAAGLLWLTAFLSCGPLAIPLALLPLRTPTWVAPLVASAVWSAYLAGIWRGSPGLLPWWHHLLLAGTWVASGAFCGPLAGFSAHPT